jgi:Arc/MetJ-type ribon-helix-helix transcriptional regulator
MIEYCNKSDYMNVNLYLSGELEAFIDELVERGLAANKTEAIRLAIIHYYEEQRNTKKKVDSLNQSTIEAHWNNPSDEKSADFYLKRYLHGKKV